MGRLLAWFVAVAAVGCNALTGVGDFSVVDGDTSVADAAPGTDARTDALLDAGDVEGASDAQARDADAAPVDASADADAALLCEARFADCNGNASDGCEVDTRTDPNHCGDCKKPCTGATLACVNGSCAVPSSCKALLALGKPSGMYMISAASAGNPLSVYCDMTTGGGGWTVVFLAPSSNLASQTIDYTSATPELLNAAAETLLAYRLSDGTLTGSRAVFALPAAWKTASPFKASNTDLPVAVRIDGAQPVQKTLRFGYASFGDNCDSAWILTSAYGRVCIAQTNAPFFNGFAQAEGDFCTDGTKLYNGDVCGAQRVVSVAVR